MGKVKMTLKKCVCLCNSSKLKGTRQSNLRSGLCELTFLIVTENENKLHGCFLPRETFFFLNQDDTEWRADV